MDPLITCAKLTKRFRRVMAVDGLDLTVEPGDIFGFLGPNGAGKSTTLRMMVGLIRPTSGSVRIFGQDVRKNHCLAMSGVGAMVEAPAFYNYLSGRDNLRILANTGRTYSDKEIDETLDIVGLLSRAKDKVKAYSQGMRQRLAIASAIIGKPKLVLLDEPTNGLDPQGMKEVRDLIKSLALDHGLTVFLSSHLLHEVEQVCTRIAVINKGKLIESGSVGELLGASDCYRLQVDSSAQVLQVLDGLDWVKVNQADESGVVVCLTDKTSAEMNRLLVDQGIGVLALVPQKTSLEDLYLKLMEGGSD